MRFITAGSLAITVLALVSLSSRSLPCVSADSTEVTSLGWPWAWLIVDTRDGQVVELLRMHKMLACDIVVAIIAALLTLVLAGHAYRIVCGKAHLHLSAIVFVILACPLAVLGWRNIYVTDEQQMTEGTFVLYSTLTAPFAFGDVIGIACLVWIAMGVIFGLSLICDRIGLYLIKLTSRYWRARA